MKKFFAVLILLGLAPSAHAQSLDKAKLLYTNKLYAEAKRELVAIAVSEASEQERAAALSLLGSIAMDEGHYDSAISNWEQLIAKYPDTQEAHEAQAKLPLARKLLSAGKAPEASPGPKPLAPGTVLISGSAPEAPEYADQAVLEFMNLLTSNGVRVKNASSGRAGDVAGRAQQGTLPNLLLENAQETGAAGVLYVFIHFSGMENMRVECYSSDGRKLWEEKVTASLSLTAEGKTEGFIKRMSKKLLGRVGGPCLPRAGTKP
jgi:tetratricopeptide (TPR) repeat protein